MKACGILKVELNTFVKSGAVKGVSRALGAQSPSSRCCVTGTRVSPSSKVFTLFIAHGGP